MRRPKTNAMRLLDRAQIKYEIKNYVFDDSDLSGMKAAQALGLPPAMIFKTIVLRGNKSDYLVGCIPVDQEIDVKQLALLSGDKHIEMIQQKDLLALTGYVRGGCSPLAMKKSLPTFIDEQALSQERIAISAGKRGLQILLEPHSLAEYLNATIGRFTRSREQI